MEKEILKGEWADFLESLNLFTEDFMENGREEGLSQEREAFWDTRRTQAEGEDT